MFFVLKAAAIDAKISESSGLIPDARHNEIVVNKVSPDPIVSNGLESKAGQKYFSLLVNIVAPYLP